MCSSSHLNHAMISSTSSFNFSCGWGQSEGLGNEVTCSLAGVAHEALQRCITREQVGDKFEVTMNYRHIHHSSKRKWVGTSNITQRGCASQFKASIFFPLLLQFEEEQGRASKRTQHKFSWSSSDHSEFSWLFIASHTSHDTESYWWRAWTVLLKI
jgi:hypothetical protein